MDELQTQYNILSIDGGPAAPVQIRLLRKLEEKHPGFLAAADMFAGTSDGAMLASFIASRLPADRVQAQKMSLDILDDAIEFSNHCIFALQPRPWSILRFMTGTGPLLEFRRLEAVLEHAFGGARVKDIERSILIAAYDCDRWRMHNFVKVGSYDVHADTTIRDASLASASLPMYAPAHRASSGSRFLDGAFIANNPSMLAAGAFVDLLWLQHHFAGTTLNRADLVSRVRVLSLGIGEQNAATTYRPIDSFPTFLQQLRGIEYVQSCDTTLKWGWLQWLVQRPTLLASVLNHAQSSSTSFECGIFLRGGNHCRYAPAGATISVVFDIARRNAEGVINEAERLANQIWQEYSDWKFAFGSDDPTSKMLRFVDKRWMRDSDHEEPWEEFSPA